MKVWMAFFGQGTPYLYFHEEVEELLIFLNDRGGLLSEEVRVLLYCSITKSFYLPVPLVLSLSPPPNLCLMWQ